MIYFLINIFIKRDKFGNIFEMVKECVRIYQKEKPDAIEAIVFHVFWV